MATRRQATLKMKKTTSEPMFNMEQSEESSSSEDEYVEDSVSAVKAMEKRHGRLNRPPVVSDSDSIADTGKRRLSRHKISVSPSPSTHGHLKRKATNATRSSSPPLSKRKKSGDAGDDPARKYCLSKLEELFKDVFLRYPHVHVPASDGDESKPEDLRTGEEHLKTTIVPKKIEELSDEEKEDLIKESQQFSRDLEVCIFEIYAEPDKSGHPHAGGKYKERFRMLQFNLSKVDRIVIHQRITSGTISPKEISLMSSTDLADEETKQSIKLAEQEALEHSILLKSTVPRAKITHKGLQDIEDVNGEVATAHEKEVHKEREQEEEERRERERMARLRTTQRHRTASVSIPPESPTTGEQSWGGPPPVPVHVLSPTSAEFPGLHTSARPALFMQTSDLTSSEPELNLADLINIDDEQDPASSGVSQPVLGPNIVASPVDGILPTAATAATPTGISPFAARPEKQRGASFDLNALWNMPKGDASKTDETSTLTPPETAPTAVPSEEPLDGSDKDDAMELESVEANDQDFDMFLEEKETQEHSEELIITPIPPRDVETLPEVWTGKLAMPLDSSVPQETSLVARQIAGRPLPPDSPLWKTLFPSDQLRIEGRVPVENSVKYLLGMRLNPAKEMYAAVFAPASQEHERDFQVLCDFLISKNRHGLVFPWGSRPKEYHPGRELYMIPLRQTDTLPEFVELLDELKLPKIRSKDYLLGVWLLNKGKLAILPGVPQQSTTPPNPPQLSQTPPLSTPMFNNPPPGSQLPPQLAPSLPPSIPGLPVIAPAALAAEVASLTPEQLQELLRTLATTQIQLPPLPQPVPPAVPPVGPPNINRPPSHHMPPPIGAPPPVGQHPPMLSGGQPWMQPPPHPYPNFPPPNVPFQPPMHGMSPAPPASRPSFDRPEYERQDYGRPGPTYDRPNYDRDFQPGPHYGGGNRSERGWRGNASHRGGGMRGGPRGRGRDRERSGEGHDFDRRSSDAGWPRRQRNEGQGGPSW
ncbi:hypothetical protein BDN70DRAFT_417191 [Pholiota conissans]|uniref:TFIIS central domain-containing protein n=1 Tax=Pholiota conissans TaxID=109636 RepID=A0A9P6D3J5_9AGAR|nr:hypothetical protein BDN70DRAFT_417191 [Pholiota conissans]